MKKKQSLAKMIEKLRAFDYPNCSVVQCRRQCGPVVRALGLHAAAPGSNPVITSGLDLSPVVPDSTLPCFVNSQLVASHQLGFLICFC